MQVWLVKILKSRRLLQKNFFILTRQKKVDMSCFPTCMRLEVIGTTVTKWGRTWKEKEWENQQVLVILDVDVVASDASFMVWPWHQAIPTVQSSGNYNHILYLTGWSCYNGRFIEVALKCSNFVNNNTLCCVTWRQEIKELDKSCYSLRFSSHQYVDDVTWTDEPASLIWCACSQWHWHTIEPCACWRTITSTLDVTYRQI